MKTNSKKLKETYSFKEFMDEFFPNSSIDELNAEYSDPVEFGAKLANNLMHEIKQQMAKV